MTKIVASINRERRLVVFACVAAMSVFAAAYSNSLRSVFHFDDVYVVEGNLYIRDLKNIPRFFADAQTFSSLPQNATYRPVESVSLALDYAVGGLNPVVFHTTQLFLFAVIGVLLAFLYMNVFASTPGTPVTPWPALFAATLFCVHAGNTMVANYITARSELLALIGVLGSFMLYIYAPKSRRYYLYLLPMVAGALAKTPAVIFAPLLLTYKLLIEENFSAGDVISKANRATVLRTIRSTLPAFVLGLALFVFAESMNAAGQGYGGGRRSAYIITQAWIWVRYVRMYFVPTGMTADTDIKLFDHADVRTMIGFAMFAGTLVAAWFASKSAKMRPVAFGIVWFWLALVPTSTLFPLSEVTNDYRAFFPWAGLNLAVTCLVVVLVRKMLRIAGEPHRKLVTTATAVAATLLIVGHAAGTFERNKVWRTDEALWEDVAKKSPRNGRGLMNYGVSMMQNGRLAEARDLFVRAQQFAPDYSVLEVNLAIVNGALGDQAAAEAHFKRAILLDAAMPSAHVYYSRWLIDHGRAPEAEKELQQAIAVSPGDLASLHMLMSLYAARESTGQLQDLARATLRVSANDTVAAAYAGGNVPMTPATNDFAGWFALGWSLTQSSRHMEAVQAYRRAARLNAGDADTWNNLGWSLGKLGFFEAAVAPLQRAVTLRPSNTLAANNLAWVQGELARSRNSQLR